MVFVKVRETYDLATVQGKMTTIGIHTPRSDIIKRNFPGLLLQCKAYRPVSCDVRLACASMLPLDPLGVGTSEGDVAPEDMFNPILYKSISNVGMSQLEARIAAFSQAQNPLTVDVAGSTATVDVDNTGGNPDDFNIYYGLLADAHGWKHANPQSGLVMTDLKPYVSEVLVNVSDNGTNIPDTATTLTNITGGPHAPSGLDGTTTVGYHTFYGNPKPMPFINCTDYSGNTAPVTAPSMGFDGTGGNGEQNVPWIRVMTGCIIIPPSRLHQLFFRMVVEWTIEFSSIRSVLEIQTLGSLGSSGAMLHYQNYDYSEATKVTGVENSELIQQQSMVDTNTQIKKVM